MARTKIRKVIESAIISAFTIATALIWKDIIIEFIEEFFPHGDILLFKFITAIIATAIAIIAIYLLLKTEDEAEHVIKIIKNKKTKNKNEKVLITKPKK